MPDKEFSKQEFFIGLVAVLPLVFIIGGLGFFSALACGLVWVLGGSYGKPIRRFGVPFIIWSHVEITRGWPAIDLWPVVAFALGVAILHIGDGFPDRRPTTQDEGSALGRFVERFFPNDEIGGPITKWLIALIFQVSLIPYWVIR